MTFYYDGSSGNDYFDYRGNTNLVAQGYGGNDSIFGDAYGDSLYGGSGNDKLLGYGGNDLLIGSLGSDELNGGTGNDTLRGFSWGYNREIDTLIGGRGRDTFMLGDTTGVFYLGGRTSNGRDASYARIADWNPREDRIQAHDGSSSYRLVKNQNWFGSSAKDTGIYVGNDLIGVIQDSTNVSSQNFVFV
ncbi:calcium-binding protein [Oculatella sp. LEGE 06141]|uniref:calcium-binding protein n=1 Tax=Oculatella sp. LEGE 06141 TaxID=1828648 RepID=UPI00187EE0BD|nr:calcium-binding protein [Oculatella sp. LEGE 06141]MBE9182948.1 calcium-binding protein [Oculatella sp. LEGE 06141]